MITKWDQRHFAAAVFISRRSKDVTKVGAVLASPSNAELLNAYNGPPQWTRDDPERFDRPAKYLFASHAEQNLISFAARHGIRTDGCLVYVTHHPCAACARMLIQAGIARIVYGRGTTAMPADEFHAARVMLAEARIQCEAIEEEESTNEA